MSLDGLTPAALRGKSDEALVALAARIRRFLLDSVPETGGHLASNLGSIELAVALHAVFESPEDRILWDVGHQAYPHKVLTGRAAGFPTLRQTGGLGGFLDRDESEHDPYGGSHAGTAMSAAAGLLEAHRRTGRAGHVVAVVGDGALTAGMCWEALNNLGGKPGPLLVVLNDNGMSISPNVGMVRSFLTGLRSAPVYRKSLRRASRALSGWGPGRRLRRMLSGAKDSVRNFFFRHGAPFEAFGFRYFGPVDGHDLPSLLAILRRLKDIEDRPVLLHAVTVKGKGDEPSEADPVRRHGVGAPGPKAEAPSWSAVFADTLADLADEDERVVAVTAAMAEGTGLSRFAGRHPDRLFDVGISEQHAVTFATAMALEGLRPVAAIYSTFLQRGYDQVVHDAVLQRAPVVFAMDRAGLVGGDGQSAQGLYDLAYLRALPGMAVAAPRDAQALRDLLAIGLAREDGPTAIRYPRGTVPPAESRPGRRLEPGKGEMLREGGDLAILALGPPALEAVAAAAALAEEGIEAAVADAVWAKPLDHDLVASLASRGRLLTVEEAAAPAGFGAAVLEALRDLGLLGSVEVASLAVPDRVVPHGSQAYFRGEFGLDASGIAAAARTLAAAGAPK